MPHKYKVKCVYLWYIFISENWCILSFNKLCCRLNRTCTTTCELRRIAQTETYSCYYHKYCHTPESPWGYVINTNNKDRVETYTSNLLLGLLSRRDVSHQHGMISCNTISWSSANEIPSTLAWRIDQWSWLNYGINSRIAATWASTGKGVWRREGPVLEAVEIVA